MSSIGMNTDNTLYTATAAASAYAKSSATKTEKAAEEKQAETAGATVEISDEGSKALEESRATVLAKENGKMSATERKALVAQLKADADSRKNQLLSLVQQTLSGQVSAFTIGSTDDTSFWRMLASGKFTVDAETKAQAQKDIAEDGYYGVKQTSERMYQFALALSGGDVDKMKEMQAAFEKGYKMAEKTWGGKLPEISQKTYDATQKLFEDFYAAQSVQSTEGAQA